MPTADGAAAHVVVLSADEGPSGSAEREIALTLRELGFRVTLLAASAGERRHSWLGDVPVVRVPVAWTLRATVDDSRARRRRRRPPRVARHEVVDRALTRGWHAVDGLLARVPPPRGWRSVLPDADDLELGLGPAVRELRADLLVTVDSRLVVTALGAIGRSRLRGDALLWIHCPSSPGSVLPRPGSRSPRVVAALARLDNMAARWADRVVGEGPAAVPGAVAEMLGVAIDGPPVRRVSGVSESSHPPLRRPTDIPPRLAIGPANMAGQAWAWAKAMERNVPGLRTEVMMVDRGSPLVFPADELVPVQRYARDPQWAEAYEERALATWTHALLEAGRPLFGLRHGKDFRGDADLLRSAGVGVGLVFHGSEVRNPREHARRTPWSPFGDPSDELTARLQRSWEALMPAVRAFEGPTFVSTPDLLDDVPGSTWLPVVVDPGEWSGATGLLERRRPVVLHAPSRAAIKGSDHVERALAPLAADGAVEYRRLEGVAPSEMPAALRDADIVLDQFALGSYGVMACQAMAAGRVVVGHVTAEVRERVGRPLPIVEADPATLADVVRTLVRDRDAARVTAEEGTRFVREVHDGRRSAEVLVAGFGLPAAVREAAGHGDPT